MHLIQLDDDGTVVLCIPAMSAPLMQRLSANHMLHPIPVPVGYTLDDEERSFIAPPPPRHITKLAFLQRITMAENVAIELASIHDPASPQQQQVMAATLRKMQQLVNAANWIDLDRPDTRDLVLQIENFGLLAPGRALEILDAEILPIEQPSAEMPKAAGA